MGAKYIPVAYCHNCKKKQPVVLTEFVHKTHKIKATSVHCAVCEIVLNIDKKCKVGYVDEAWMNKHGWKLERSVA